LVFAQLEHFGTLLEPTQILILQLLQECACKWSFSESWRN
jgi:hypothetical protein